MDARFMLEKPGEIQATMKITMSLKSWEELRDQLDKINISECYVAYELRNKINDLFSQARKIFYPTIKEKEEADAK